MKKTRILASLLCIMMIVCALPVMQASAAVGDTFASIDQILGFQSVELARASYNFVGGLNAPAGSTTNVYYRNPDITGTVAYGENGMSFVPNGTSTIWHTTPAGAITPYVPETATVVKAQFADADDIFVIQFNHWNNPNVASAQRLRAYIEVYPTYVSSSGSSGGRSASFDFGTDEFEMMYVPLAEGHQIYARKGNDAWTLLLDVEGYRSGSTSGLVAISSKTDVVIKSMKTYGKYVSPEEKIATVLGEEAVVVNPSLDFQFTQSGFTTPANVTAPTGTVYGTTNGLDLTNIQGKLAQASWRYLPWQGYCVFDHGKALVFKVKIPSDGALNIQAYVPVPVNGVSTVARLYLDINASRVSLSSGSQVAPFAPGNDWVEYMVTRNGTTGLKVYAKSPATGDEWLLINQIADGSYKSGGGTGTGLAYYSTCTDTGNGTGTTHAGAYIGYTTLYTAAEKDIDTMEEILGGVTGSTYELAFDETTSFANTNGRVGFSGADNFTTDAEGLTLKDPADTSSKIKYGPFSKWSPLNSTTIWNTGTYIPQALYVKAKGGFLLDATGTNGNGRIYFLVQSNGNVIQNQDIKTYSLPIVVNDEWVEYLFVPNGRTENTDVTALGYATYIKGATTTNGKWRKIGDGSFYKVSDSMSNTNQLGFTQVTGHIKLVRTLSLNASFADSAIIPAGADYLYVNEDFSDHPGYGNYAASAEHVVYENGSAKAVCTTKSGKLAIRFNNVIIPVGGYAEFRTRYSGTGEYYFHDGEKVVGILQQSDYGTVTGGIGFSGNTNNSWRTWRIVRTADGYTVYSKCDTDTGWFRSTLNAGDASTAAAQSFFQFSMRNDGGTGDSQIDYFKVYGPAPTGVMTLTDGYSTMVLNNGDALTYKNTLRAIVSEDNAKLLVISYVGNDLKAAQIVNAADMINDSKTFDVRGTGVTKVKVFLWDGLSKMNPLTPAVTLNL